MSSDTNELPWSLNPIPAPPLEATASPLTSEVSLLDQDKSKSFQMNISPEVNSNAGNYRNNEQIPKYNEDSIQNQHESYNTWKAKNAEALQSITGSLERTKRSIGGTRKVNDSKKHQVVNGEHFVTEDFSSSSKNNPCTIIKRTLASNHHYETRSRPVPQNVDLNKRQSICHRPADIVPQQDFDFGNNHLHSTRKDTEPLRFSHPGPNEHKSYRRDTDMIQEGRQINRPTQDPTFLRASNLNPYRPRPNVEHVPFDDYYVEEPRPAIKHSLPDVCCTFPNEEACRCRQNCKQAERNETENLRETKNSNIQTYNLGALMPLELVQMNNQTELYKIIKLQNDQIIMLQQQMNQVLQLHTNCDKASVKEQKQCKKCSSSKCCSSNDSESESGKTKMKKNKHSERINSPKTTKSHSSNSVKKKSKRSIGVMTTQVKNSSSDDSSTCDDLENNSNVSGTRIRQNQTACKSSGRLQKIAIKKVDPVRKHKKKIQAQHLLTKNKKFNKDISKPSNDADESFSLNEAELVVRTETDDEDNLPNNSVHIDLQDYCSTSHDSESEVSASCSGEENHGGEISEEEFTDPQIGWTFYNKVVGQVNNVLKRGQSHRQPPPYIPRRPYTNYYFDRNRDYEHENNWSKRVTFDGPPLGDSDEFRTGRAQAPWFPTSRHNQEYRPNDGHDRMQDFMMYNFANGNANLSFSTMRYLERYDSLPAFMKNKPPEYLHPEYPANIKTKKDSTKSRHPEAYTSVSHQKQKKKTKPSYHPSSKLWA